MAGHRVSDPNVLPAPGGVQQVDLIRYLGVACGPANPVDTQIIFGGAAIDPRDMADRAARLVGIVYGEAAQLQQLTPADAMAPNLSLEAISFLSVYDAVADDWNRAREGAVVGSLLTDPADRAARLLGIVYGDLGQINQVVPADGLAPGNALSIAGFTFVFNGVTWDMVREGNVAGSLLADVTDRAGRLLGVVYGDLAQLQQIAAPGDALVPANTLESTGLLYVYNGATWDRVLEGAIAGSILTDPADRAGRLVGIVYGSIAQIQQLAALADGVNPSNTLESTGMLYVYNGATWDRVREGTIAGSIIVDVGSPSTVLNNVRVTNAGVRLQLIVAATIIKSVTVKALTTNTGLAYVGNATVAAANGFPLAAGETVSMDIDDLNKVYFDVAVNGEGVSYLAVA